jgi:hypothetical protein
MTKPAPQFRQIASPLDDISDDALDKIGDALGVPSLVMPEPPPAPRPLLTSEPSPPKPPRAMAKAGSKSSPQTVPLPVEERAMTSLEKISVELPDYLPRAMRIRVAEEGTTLRYLIMQGLQAIGFTIDPLDFVTDGRSFRSKPR